MLDCEIVVTKSGAPAMHDRLSGETMHPVVGPLVEGREVYLEPAHLDQRLRKGTQPLVLLDAGLGAGTNALLAFRLATELPGATRKLRIISIDHSSRAFSLALESEHAVSFGFDDLSVRAGRELLETGASEATRTTWEFRLGDLALELGRIPDASVDVVFWDPFSAASAPELWSVEIFLQLWRVCRAGATVHTFCASTPVRSALLLAGFVVGEGPVTGNGRPTTRAGLNLDDVSEPLRTRFLERLRRSSAPFPADAPADALERVRQLAQFSGSEPSAF